MKFIQLNMGKPGRVLRVLIGLVLLGAAIAACTWHWLVGLGLAVAGAFCLFEAARGWCMARACGVKTRW